MSIELVPSPEPTVETIDIQEEYNKTTFAIQAALAESKIPTVMLLGMLDCMKQDMRDQMKMAEARAAQWNAAAEGKVQ